MLKAHSSYIYYIELITHWYQKFISQRQTIYLLFKNYWLVEVTHMLIRFNKSEFLLRNTKNIVRNCVNEKKTYAHHIQRERWPWKGLVSVKISDTLLFHNNTSNSATAHLLWENLNPNFLRKFRKLKPPLWISTMKYHCETPVYAKNW